MSPSTEELGPGTAYIQNSIKKNNTQHVCYVLFASFLDGQTYYPEGTLCLYSRTGTVSAWKGITKTIFYQTG